MMDPTTVNIDTDVSPLKNQLEIGSTKDSINLTNGIDNNKISSKEHLVENGIQVHWGFSSSELYRIAMKFYKEKEGKAVHIGYEDKTRLVALTQQVTHGPCDPNTAPTLGVFDVVGKDRRLAWQALGTLNNADATQQFIDKLNDLAPTFGPYVEAIWADHLEKERIAREEEELKKEEEIKREEEEKKIKEEEDEKRQQEEKKRQIQEALNQQTYDQFRKYAEHWYPGNPEQQGVLILQLQKQHYEQYMQQVYQQQLLLQQQNNNQDSQDCEATTVCEVNDEISEEKSSMVEANHSLQDIEQQHILQEEEDEDNTSIAAASMWTRRDIRDFKDSIRREGGDSVIKVGHGETVTVRVPTHEDGTCLFWEFATDSYDIGFGVYFEWTTEIGSVVSVHISESEDEDEEEEDDEENPDDIERLAGSGGEGKPPVSLIIPVYRRDCHEEVYAGSHVYPGQGVYLLKFDNSYSLWRSKTLYYRVYYTR